MKAILLTRFGSPDVLQLEEVEKPAPKEDEVLIKVHAASVNALDYRLMRSSPFPIRLLIANGLIKPKDQRMGADVAGRIEAVGENVSQFKPGDDVFGGCSGGFAEYAVASEKRLALKPSNSTFEQAASVPVAALTALQGLRDFGHIQPGQKVMIDGASGGVGSFAVQIAKSFGTEVTAVCSTRNLDMARSIGADHVIDYKKEDPTQDGQKYDLIFAVNGYHPIMARRHSLTPKGNYIVAGGTFRALLEALIVGPSISKKGGQKFGLMSIAKITREDLSFMGDLLKSGKVVPVIDKAYPLSETADAIRYVEDVHAQGKVVITVEPGA